MVGIGHHDPQPSPASPPPAHELGINQPTAFQVILGPFAIDLTKDVSDAVLYQRQFSQADTGWLSNRVMTVLWRVVAVTGWHAAVNHHDHSFAAAAPELGTDHR